MRVNETPVERHYRESIEAAISELDTGTLNLDSDSKEHMTWAILHHALEEAERMPDDRLAA